MAGKSQELISKLLQAEEEAEKIIRKAREMRSEKLKDVKSAAQEELGPFRMREEQKFAEEQRAKATSAAASGDLDKNTAAELAMVKNDYETNKKGAIKYVLDKVLDIDITIPPNVKQQLMGGAAAGA